MRAWNIQDAKAKFCQIVKDAENSPQEICKNGEPVAFIISKQEYYALKKQKKIKRLGDALINSPLADTDLDIKRDDHHYREY